MDHIKEDKFGDIVVNDKDWNPIRRQIIYSEIMAGSYPEAAAAQADIPPAKFKKWMKESETFKMYIDYLVAISRGILRKKVFSAITDLEEAEDPDKVAGHAMKLLSHIDPEFGKKHIDITDGEKEVKKPKRDYNEMIKKAEEIANKEPDDS